MAKVQLRRVLTNPERMADFKNANIAAFSHESAGLTPAAALQASATMSKSVGRNDPCPCGSGKKFKKCCLQ